MSDRNQPSLSEPFNNEMARMYDQRNSKLHFVSDCAHFLMRLVLRDLPERARILCVGVGTGADILALASEHPQWTFLGVDPSANMLHVCRQRLQAAGLEDRCELVEGYVADVREADFDAAVSLLVAHFVALADRPAFYRAIAGRLKQGGRFLSAEISADLNAAEFPQALEDWNQIQWMTGATEAVIASMEDTLRNVLSVIPADRTESLLRDAGFSVPGPFFQAFMIRGLHAAKL